MPRPPALFCFYLNLDSAALKGYGIRTSFIQVGSYKMLTSTRDFLLSGTSNFARALDTNGVEAKLVVFDGLPHAFWSYMDIPETDEANALVARFMKSKLNPTKLQK